MNSVCTAELAERAWKAIEEALENCPAKLLPTFRASCQDFADKAVQVTYGTLVLHLQFMKLYHTYSHCQIAFAADFLFLQEYSANKWQKCEIYCSLFATMCCNNLSICLSQSAQVSQVRCNVIGHESSVQPLSSLCTYPLMQVCNDNSL